jgi:hypothetical protein
MPHEVPSRLNAGDFRVSISVVFDAVKIQIECGDAYQARVMHDDLVDRLSAGENVSIHLLGFSPKVKHNNA